MKRDSAGKFTHNWDSESKQQVSVTLTATAWQRLEVEAQHRGISRSEVIEQFARSLGTPEAPNTGKSVVTVPEAIEPHSATMEHQVVTILETISDAFVAFDADWHYTYVNQAAARLLQKTPEELLGKHVWREVFPSIVGELPYQQLHRAVAEQVPVEWVEWSPIIERWLEANAYPAREGVAVYFRDITKRQQAEAEREELLQALARERSLLKAVLQQMPAGVIIAEAPSGKLILGNQQTEQIWRRPFFSSAEIEDYEHYQGFYPDGRPYSPQDWPLARSITTGEVVTQETIHMLRGDGTLGVMEVNSTPIYDSQGKIVAGVTVFQDITDRQQITAALQKSEAKFRRLVEASMFGVALGDFQGNVLYANDALLKLIGYSREELEAGQISWLDLTPPEHLPLDIQAGEEMRRTGIATPFEKEYIHKDGHRVPILIGGALLSEPYAEQQQIIGFYLDLTELKQTEAALREQQLLLETILKQAADAIIVCNAEGKLAFVNAKARRLARFTPETLPLEHLSLQAWGTAHDREGNLIALEDYAMTKALRGESSSAVESRMVFDDGSYYDILASAAPLRNQSQQIIGAVCTFVDISDRVREEQERKRAEMALRESEERLRLALISTHQGLYDLNVQTGEAIVSDEYALMLDYDPQEFQETNAKWRERLHPDDIGTVYRAYEDYIAGKQPTYRVEFRQRTQLGQWKWILSIGKIVAWDQQGQPLRMLGTHTDITERKLAEEAIRNSAERLSVALAAARLGDWSWDLQTDQVNFSERACQLFEIDPQQPLTWTELRTKLHPEDQARTQHQVEQAIAHAGNYDIEYRVMGKQGKPRWIAARGRAQQDATGQVWGMLGVVQDITHRKLAEAEREELLTREKAAREAAENANRVKDEFLAVLSHELRSPLNPILGWAKLLQTHVLDEAAKKRALETIERNAKLQAQLIEDLLDVSRILRGKMTLNIGAVNLPTMIESALETVQLAAEAKQIKIDKNFGADDCQISGDPARLQQIIWNLLSNAVKFTPPGGRIEIHLQTTANAAKVQIQDNGKGIKPEFLPYVFDHFRQEDGKTTRQFGGLGLGLAIARHVTELHGGTIQAESEGEGQGATFILQFPLLGSHLPTENTPQNIPASFNFSHLQILVVDDDPDMRTLAQVILEQQGAQVQVAANAMEVMEFFDRQPPDLLISDVGMPQIDGYQLMQSIRRRPPEQGGLIPAIALTAYAGEYDQQQALKAGFQQHLAKPIEPAALVEAIGHCLAQTHLHSTLLNPD